MSDLATPLQQAIIARLRGDATLQGLMVGASAPEWNIFDKGGGGVISPAFPYVYVHPITMAPGSLLTMGTDANDIFHQVDVYTKTEGFWQAQGIVARVYALLHGPLNKTTPLVLSSGAVCVLLFENRQELEEISDGLIQHIADRYKVQTQG